MLMHGGEGLEVAEQLNAWGITAFVLTYRLSPRYDDDARTLDGQRAMQVVRARAAEWKLDPARIGFAGFSAGSALGRLVAAGAKAGDPQAGDAIGRVSSRPDFLVLVYSAGRATPGEDLKTFPPTFLTCAARDTGPANGSRRAVRRAQQGRRQRRDPHLSAGPPRLRRRPAQPGVLAVDAGAAPLPRPGGRRAGGPLVNAARGCSCPDAAQRRGARYGDARQPAAGCRGEAAREDRRRRLRRAGLRAGRRVHDGRHVRRRRWPRTPGPHRRTGCVLHR